MVPKLGRLGRVVVETGAKGAREVGADLTVGIVLTPGAPDSGFGRRQLGSALTGHGAVIRMIPLPQGPSGSSGHARRDSGVAEQDGIIAAQHNGAQQDAAPAGGAPTDFDVLIVDVSAAAVEAALAAIADDPTFRGIPVVVALDSAGRLTPEQYVRYGVTDFVLPTVDADELILRLRVILARRKNLQATETAAEALRSRVREVSAALAVAPETHDPTALSRIFLEGLARAFDADRVYLELFDEQETGLFMEQWPARRAATLPPGVTGSDAVHLAGILWNGSRIGIFGHRPSDKDAHPLPGFVPLTDTDTAPYFTVAAPLGDAEDVSGLVQIISDTGPLPWTDVHSSLLQHVIGNFLRALHQAKLHALNAEAIARLTSLNFLKDDFVATINHEFRSPLATITGHLEIVADGLLGPIAEDRRGTLDILLRNTARLNNLVENILTVSALDQPYPEPGPVDVSKVATAIIASSRAAAAAKGITLTSELPDYPVMVSGHSGQLEEALRNVLRNSLDYTTPHGTITLTLRSSPIPATHAPHLTAPDGTTGHQPSDNATPRNPPGRTGPEYALITVQDTGIGIPDVDLPHLYTSFYRGSNIKRTSAPGSGLGLTITKQILDRHEGTITVASTPGHGTTTTIQLPLTNTRGVVR